VSIHQIASACLRAIVMAAMAVPLPATVASAVAVDKLAVGALAGGGVGGFDQRPAQVVGPEFAQCAAAVLLA